MIRTVESSDRVSPALEEGCPGPKSHWLSWLGLSLIVTGAVFVTGVHLPSVAKKLGLFAVGLGLLSGWALSRLASAFGVPGSSRRFAAIVVFVVILLGQIAMAVEGHRMYLTDRRHRLAADPKSAAAIRLLNSSELPRDAESRQSLARLRQMVGREATFRDYLRFRVSELGPRIRPFAAPLWIGEIVLGSLAGAWLFGRLACRTPGGSSV